MNILITGASGFLATEIINQLQHTEHSIFALSSNKEKLTSKNEENIISLYDFEDWNKNLVPMDNIDVVIHCAFARAHKGGAEIAKSLLFTQKLFETFSKNQVSSVINISTQEVYGKNATPWKENQEVLPNTIYATAKYYTELLTNEFA